MKQLLGALVLSLLGAIPAVASDLPVTRRVLPNGMTVVVREDPGVGVVAASLQVRAGSMFETEGTAGITHFVQRVLLRGTEKRSALALAEAATDGRLRADQLLVLNAMGGGFTWGSALVRW